MITRVRRIMLFLAITVLILAAACSKTAERPPFLPPSEPVPPPEMEWDVRADYSNLTAYVPPFTTYTRLHPGPLPELIPSDEYGTLLPYASASIFPDGSLITSKQGLVTIGGMVVTDLIYDRVERAYSRPVASFAPPSPLPAYRLAIDLPGSESRWYTESRQAACALDGSWVTPVEYVEIVFTEDLIILMRSHQVYDFDVYDYDGRLLYNMLECGWVYYLPRDAWPGELAFGISEGSGVVRMNNETVAFIDILTGQARYTEYIFANPFSEGLAAVAVKNGNDETNPFLWGVINKNFELVIPPKSVDPPTFMNGMAVIRMPDSGQQVINRRGEAVFSVPPGSFIEQRFDGSIFTVHHEDNRISPTNFTYEFIEIELPERVRQSTYGYIYLNLHGGGWYSFDTDGGTVLFSLDEDYWFHGIGYISYFDGEYIIYSEYSDAGYQMGVMTLDGREIIRPEQDVTISAVSEGETAKAFIVNSNSNYRFFGDRGPGGNAPIYKPSKYKLINLDGSIITSGHGILTYDEAEGLYSALGIDHFAWLDPDASVIINIPLMSYMLD